MSHSIRRHNTDVSTRSTKSTGSRYSDDSQDSHSTAPTSVYSRPSLHHAFTDRPIYSKQFDVSPATSIYARSSTDTYHSSTDSLDEAPEEEPYEPDYELPKYRGEVFDSVLRPSNPSDFADFFPSTRRLYIRHDDTTPDGNLNLRVDTESRKRGAVQLFHLRMHDIKKREFSLRRYERSSGREVCHSSRKHETSSSENRPALARSVSNALSSFRRPEPKRQNSSPVSPSPRSKKDVRRQDSGYGSNEEADYFDTFTATPKPKSIAIPTNTTKLEFSNYAQVEVKRRGAKSSKRYEFEYWGHKYAWKRSIAKDGNGKEVSYHLFKDDTSAAMAHIVPEIRTPSQVKEEMIAGGWVPPCSMWISDHSVLEALTDVADVIVSTGLIALVDDCIKRHFHSKSKPRHSHSSHTSMSIPLTRMDVEFVSPKKMVESIFKRRDSGASYKEREMRQSPLRYSEVESY